MKPFRSSTFFRDGLSTRAPIDGTVARGFLKIDTEFFTGKKAGRPVAVVASAAPAQPAGPQPAAGGTAAPLQGAAAYPDDVELFPIPVTKDVVTRGKERYEIFCAACHGLTGNGDGMIVGAASPGRINVIGCARRPWATSSMLLPMVGERCPVMRHRFPREIAGQSSPTFALCN